MTCNSERHLREVLDALVDVADDIVALDSGSSDSTLNILAEYPTVRVFHRSFDNFRDQRNHAASLCRYDAVFYVDSDEVIDAELAGELRRLKTFDSLGQVAYCFCRRWFALGSPVHALYPVVSPDFVVRLFDRRQVSFCDRQVHETISGYTECRTLDGSLLHMTFHDRAELDAKLQLYTSLAASDLLSLHRHISPFRLLFDPIAAWVKWYFLKRGFLDGRVGLTLAAYAYRYTREKYLKARRLSKI